LCKQKRKRKTTQEIINGQIDYMDGFEVPKIIIRFLAMSQYFHHSPITVFSTDNHEYPVQFQSGLEVDPTFHITLLLRVNLLL